jgi:hypothetical protein
LYFLNIGEITGSFHSSGMDPVFQHVLKISTISKGRAAMLFINSMFISCEPGALLFLKLLRVNNNSSTAMGVYINLILCQRIVTSLLLWKNLQTCTFIGPPFLQF